MNFPFLPTVAQRSVLDSQKDYHDQFVKVSKAKEALAKMEARLQVLIERHRSQIRVSLSSKDDAERALAEGIANFWEVTKEDKPSGQ